MLLDLENTIYFDHSATTPLFESVRDQFIHYSNQFYANPSSIYRPAQKAATALFQAKRNVAQVLNCDPQEIIFTSGGSESINTAIQGIVFSKLNEKKIHVISSYAEHPATLSCLFQLKRLFNIELTFLPLDQYGQLNPDNLRKALQKHTCLVTACYANSEIGTIQPINELAKITQERNIPFHCDAVQAASTLEIDVKKLGVNLMSLSAHKFYGVKGVGILYCHKNIQFEPLIHGGAQEQGKRAGTENTIGYLMASDALKKVRTQQTQFADVSQYTKILHQEMCQLKQIKLTGHPTNRLAFHLSYIVKKREANFLLMQLDLAGICASSGTACSTGNFEPSRLLLELGYSKEDALCSLRLTLGLLNKSDDIDKFLALFKKIIS